MRAAEPQDAFSAYLAYREELASVLSGTTIDAEHPALPADIAAHLDGLPYKRLRQNVPIATRRSLSTFFTGSALRARLVYPYRELIAGGARVLDPACGAGDLLLAAAELLPVHWSRAIRLRHISARFQGRDLVPVLVDVTKDRLRLAATAVGGRMRSPSASDLPLIRVGDGLAGDVEFRSARLVLLNPPYGRTVLSRAQSWGEGLTSEAAPFTLEVLRRCRPGTNVAAILPEVLRSGSRYARWRAEVERLADIERVEVIGLFDQWTDIDVFIAHLSVREQVQAPAASQSIAWQANCVVDRSVTETLGDVAEIAIGDVVPHRHEEAGPMVPYLSVQSVPIGVVVGSAPVRAFGGRLHKAPFVVVRRTSAPTRGNGSRICGSIVTTSLGHAAVENHLVIIKPLTGGVAACRRILRQLQHPSVTAWLDARLRTRHLTKQALLEIPLPDLP